MLKTEPYPYATNEMEWEFDGVAEIGNENASRRDTIGQRGVL